MSETRIEELESRIEELERRLELVKVSVPLIRSSGDEMRNALSYAKGYLDSADMMGISVGDELVVLRKLTLTTFTALDAVIRVLDTAFKPGE